MWPPPRENRQSDQRHGRVAGMAGGRRGPPSNAGRAVARPRLSS